jgi:hypothetical protein
MLTLTQLDVREVGDEYFQRFASECFIFAALPIRPIKNKEWSFQNRYLAGSISY